MTILKAYAQSLPKPEILSRMRGNRISCVYHSKPRKRCKQEEIF